MAAPTPCWYCEYFKSIDTRSGVVSCSRRGWSNKAGDGCDTFLRVPGVDDDGWSPLQRMIVPAAPAPVPPPRARRAGADGWWTEPRRAPRPTPVAQQVVALFVPVRDPFGGLFDWDDA